MFSLESTHGPPRWIDNIQCSTNVDDECEIYPLQDGTKVDVQILTYSYLAQVFTLLVSARFAFTARDEVNWVALSVYLVLSELYVFLYIWPAILITLAAKTGLLKGLAIWFI